MPHDRALLLEERLKIYRVRLEKWVLGGIGGEGNPDVQWTTHIITVNDNTDSYNISSIDEYILKYDALSFFALPWSEIDFSKGYFSLNGKKYELVQVLTDSLVELKREYKSRGLKNPKAVVMVFVQNKWSVAKSSLM